MRPILIMPMPKVRPEYLVETRRLNERDAKRDPVELDDEEVVIDDLEDRRRRWRRWCGLRKVIIMDGIEQAVPRQVRIGPAASLKDCERLIEMHLRRKRAALSDRARARSKKLLELDHPATVPTAVANVQTVAWLLSETSWRGMSTCLQLTSPPLHVQTLTVKWWISTPAPLRLGPAESLLRCLSECADNLDRLWQSVVGRMNRYGFYFVDPRLITIEFRGGGEVRRRRRAND